jgi:hypothetical protein
MKDVLRPHENGNSVCLVSFSSYRYSFSCFVGHPSTQCFNGGSSSHYLFWHFFALGLFLAWMDSGTTPSLPRTIVQPVQPAVPGKALPAVPHTLAEVYRMMDYNEFEIFSAAVVMALGEGHRFLKHCGGSGDQGVDAKLLNQLGLTVAIQSKFYAPENHVGSAELREFGFAIDLHKAAYGFFVTTSTFTEGARWVVSRANGRIRTIDGRQLEIILKHRSREIALALSDIRSGMLLS